MLEQFWRLHLLAQLAVRHSVTPRERTSLYLPAAQPPRPLGHPPLTLPNSPTPLVHRRPHRLLPLTLEPSSLHWRRRAAARKRPTFITDISIFSRFSTSCWPMPPPRTTNRLRLHLRSHCLGPPTPAPTTLQPLRLASQHQPDPATSLRRCSPKQGSRPSATTKQKQQPVSKVLHRAKRHRPTSSADASIPAVTRGR